MLNHMRGDMPLPFPLISSHKDCPSKGFAVFALSLASMLTSAAFLLLKQMFTINASVPSMDAKYVPIMDGNTWSASIYERWQPVVEIAMAGGCNPYPMVTHDGILAKGDDSFDELCQQRLVCILGERLMHSLANPMPKSGLL